MENKQFVLNGFWICCDRSIEDAVMHNQYDLEAAMRKNNIQGVSIWSLDALEQILKGGFKQ